MPQKTKFARRFSATLFLMLLVCNFAIAQSEKQVAYGVLLDNTGSMRTQFPQVIAFGNGVVKRIHRRGPVSVFNFETQGERRSVLAEVIQGLQWSQNEDEIVSYIEDLFVIPKRLSWMPSVRWVRS
ncbi:MAG: hypothetical protein H0V88_14595 [Pyrinomonadaceae bacterium]|nr:hypothetical protein [Pyrinomonadaceae bacterium]